jgi:hypothetical protein
LVLCYRHLIQGSRNLVQVNRQFPNNLQALSS